MSHFIEQTKALQQKTYRGQRKKSIKAEQCIKKHASMARVFFSMGQKHHFDTK